MGFASELTVILKDDERTLKTKFLSHDIYSVDPKDPFIKECIDICVNEFIQTPEHEFDIKIRINMVIQ